jgi:hypothetical protein
MIRPRVLVVAICRMTWSIRTAKRSVDKGVGASASRVRMELTLRCAARAIRRSSGDYLGDTIRLPRPRIVLPVFDRRADPLTGVRAGLLSVG